MAWSALCQHFSSSIVHSWRARSPGFSQVPTGATASAAIHPPFHIVPCTPELKRLHACNIWFSWFLVTVVTLRGISLPVDMIASDGEAATRGCWIGILRLNMPPLFQRQVSGWKCVLQLPTRMRSVIPPPNRTWKPLIYVHCPVYSYSIIASL